MSSDLPSAVYKAPAKLFSVLAADGNDIKASLVDNHVHGIRILALSAKARSSISVARADLDFSSHLIHLYRVLGEHTGSRKVYPVASYRTFY